MILHTQQERVSCHRTTCFKRSCLCSRYTHGHISVSVLSTTQSMFENTFPKRTPSLSAPKTKCSLNTLTLRNRRVQFQSTFGMHLPPVDKRGTDANNDVDQEIGRRIGAENSAPVENFELCYEAHIHINIRALSPRVVGLIRHSASSELAVLHDENRTCHPSAACSFQGCSSRVACHHAIFSKCSVLSRMTFWREAISGAVSLSLGEPSAWSVEDQHRLVNDDLAQRGGGKARFNIGRPLVDWGFTFSLVSHLKTPHLGMPLHHCGFHNDSCCVDIRRLLTMLYPDVVVPFRLDCSRTVFQTKQMLLSGSIVAVDCFAFCQCRLCSLDIFSLRRTAFSVRGRRRQCDSPALRRLSKIPNKKHGTSPKNIETESGISTTEKITG